MSVRWRYVQLQHESLSIEDVIYRVLEIANHFRYLNNHQHEYEQLTNNCPSINVHDKPGIFFTPDI